MRALLSGGGHDAAVPSSATGDAPKLMAHSSKPHRLAAIDVLRGLAAVAVVICHYAGHSSHYFKNFPFTFENGRYGVQLFFVISGFFIYQTIESCRSVKEFLLLRFSRLYPAYWAALALGLIADMVQPGVKVWSGGYLVNATMLQSFVGFPDVDEVFWTLAVEMSFYLLMALLQATGALRFPVLLGLVWLLLANVVVSDPSAVLTQLGLHAALIKLLYYGPFFIAGMMFYRVKRTDSSNQRLPLVVVFLCFLTAWSTGGNTIGVVAIVVFALMGLAVAGRLQFLVCRATLWLGAISYALYLVHRKLGYVALFKLDALGFDSRIAFVLVVCAALALATVLAYGIERPCLRWLRGRIRKGA